MAELTFIEQPQVSAYKKDTQIIYRVDIPANDGDWAELDISGTKVLMLDSLNSITSDTIEVWFATSTDPALRGVPGAGEWSEYTKNGEQPFAAKNDLIRNFDTRGFVRVRIVRVGVSDGPLKFAVGVSNS